MDFVGVLGVLLVGALLASFVVLGLMVRGHRVPRIPACPRCRQCLQRLRSNSCPECGVNLLETGMYVKRRQPVRRGLRLHVLLVMFGVTCPVFDSLSHDDVSDLISRNFRRRWYRGDWTATLSFKSHPVSTVAAVYPGWIPPDTATRVLDGQPAWRHPSHFPIRLEVVSSSGMEHQLFIDFHESGFRIMDQPQSTRTVDELQDPLDASALDAALKAWMIERNLVVLPEAPAAVLTARLVREMSGQAIAGERIPQQHWFRFPYRFPAISKLTELADEDVTYKAAGDGRSRAQTSIEPWMLIFPAWTLVWIVVGCCVLPASGKTRPWTRGVTA